MVFDLDNCKLTTFCVNKQSYFSLLFLTFSLSLSWRRKNIFLNRLETLCQNWLKLSKYRWDMWATSAGTIIVFKQRYVAHVFLSPKWKRERECVLSVNYFCCKWRVELHYKWYDTKTVWKLSKMTTIPLGPKEGIQNTKRHVFQLNL